jgi:hypothetical protein
VIVDYNNRCEDTELCDIWFWDGDFSRVLGHVEGKEGEWLVEKGVLHTENDEQAGVKDLIEGDIVFRTRTRRALGESDDTREAFFSWWTVNPETGVETMRSF